MQILQKARYCEHVIDLLSVCKFIVFKLSYLAIEYFGKLNFILVTDSTMADDPGTLGVI
jgi:hypothetical protein